MNVEELDTARVVRALAIAIAVAACSTREHATPASTGLSGSISRDDFAREVRDRVTDAGVAVDYDPDAFLLSARDGGALSLENVYEEYDRTPAELRARRFDELADLLVHPQRTPTSFTMSRARLRPIIRSTDYFDVVNEQATKGQRPENAAATHALDDYASIGLAVDADTSFEIVNAKMLADWGVSWDDAMKAALDNLRADVLAGFTSPSPGVFVSAWHDTYDTSRMLLPEVIASLQVRGRPVVLVPERETLIVVGDKDVMALAAAAELAVKAFDSPRRIDLVARCWDGGWKPCIPAPTAAVAARYQEIRDLGLDGDYADQKTRLERDAATRGDDVFVASFARRSGSDSHDHSYAVLTRTVPTLLPRTERVAFVDPDAPKDAKPVLVRWDDAFRVLGARWKAMPLSPPRWRVEVDGFPTDAELARLPQVKP